MNILVVGSGGRESALAWKLGKEGHKVFSAPGNGGSKNRIAFRSYEELAKFAEREGCFTVVGPEVPLSEGIVDLFYEKELPIFGPTQNAARLESDKAFAKRFMKKYRIPTARYKSFSDAGKASAYAREHDGPLVVKASGLAAGKGVFVCETTEEALKAIKKIMVDQSLGKAGNNVVVEEFLKGYEVSQLAFTDGKDIVPLELAKDYKRAYDGNKGPNTGGMGSICPVEMEETDRKILEWRIREKVMERFMEGLKKEGLDFRGVIYFGLMIRRLEPYVLEFNVRFGDPETQALLPRMQSRLLPYLRVCYERKLGKMPSIKWSSEKSVCVVLAAKGYPGHYEKGKEIKIEKPRSLVFHAGTVKDDGTLLTAGGRVMNVVALGKTHEEAARKAYTGVQRIRWEGMQYRKDIGLDFLYKKADVG